MYRNPRGHFLEFQTSAAGSLSNRPAQHPDAIMLPMHHSPSSPVACPVPEMGLETMESLELELSTRWRTGRRNRDTDHKDYSLVCSSLVGLRARLELARAYTLLQSWKQPSEL